MPWGVAAAAVAAGGAIYSSNKAADASEKASQVQGGAEEQALAYLKQTEALPQHLRGQAMSQLGGLYGFQTPMFDDYGQPMMDEAGNPMYEESGDSLAQLKQTPMYQSVMAGVPASEEAILRHAGTTGGLRSGGVQQNLATNIQGLEQQALQQSMSGLQGFANLPSNANQIAQQQGQIGQTYGQGIMGSAQAQQAGYNNAMNSLMGGAQMYAYSDVRLKSDIELIGDRNGHNWYSWTWNYAAEKLGLSGDGVGVMAHEIAETVPDAVSTDGKHLMVDYAQLGVFH